MNRTLRLIFLFLFSTMVIFGITSAQSSDNNYKVKQMTNIEITKAMIEATKAKQIDALMENFTEDAIFAQPFNPQGTDFAYKGREAIRAGFEGIFSLISSINYTNEIYTSSGDGHSVFFEAKGDMTLAGSNKEYNNVYIFRVDFNDDEKIEKLTEYTNSLYLIQTIDIFKSMRP